MSTAQIETVTSPADKAKLAVAVALVLAALASFYMLSAQGAWAQWGALLGCLILSVLVFFTSLHGKQLIGSRETRGAKSTKWCGPRAKRPFK